MSDEAMRLYRAGLHARVAVHVAECAACRQAIGEPGSLDVVNTCMEA